MATALCPACRTDNDSVWGSSRWRPIIRGKGCGMVYFARESMPPLPRDYQDDYEYLKTFTAENFACELRLRERSNRSLLQDLAALGVPHGTLMDVGAGCRRSTIRITSQASTGRRCTMSAACSAAATGFVSSIANIAVGIIDPCASHP